MPQTRHFLDWDAPVTHKVREFLLRDKTAEAASQGLGLVDEGRLESPYLAAVIAYEAAIFEYNEVVQEFDFQRRITRLREGAEAPAGSQASESSRLASPAPMAREFPYNMLEVMDALRRGCEHEIRERSTLHLFHAKDHVGVHVTTLGGL